jgi:hypothetical protein
VQFDDALRQSEFVFRARVEKIGAATMPDVPVSAANVVVSVTSVFRAPDAVRLLTGKSITVVSADSAQLVPGQEIVFLAKGWLYGSSLAVIELGREAGTVDDSTLPQRVAADTAAANDAALAARLADAVLVGSAHVADTRTRGGVDPLTVSEHSPFWSEAILDVQSVEKGTAPGPRVIVLYPESIDVMWYRAPKLRAGLEGVFLLRRGAIEGPDRDAFTALDPIDVQPASALDRVRRLVRSGG